MNPNYRVILKQIMDYKNEGVRVLISGLLIKCIIGVFYAWPILQSYHEILIGYQYQNNKYILWISYPIMILIMNTILPHCDIIQRKIGPQIIICLSTCLISISFMMMAIFNDNWIIHILIMFFIISPLIGLLYLLPFLTTWKYFIKQKQHLNSIYQLFISIGACLTIWIFISNQDNQLQFQENQIFCAECFNLQTRQSLKAIAIWIFVLGIIATILIKIPDDDISESVVDYDLLAFSHLDINVTTQHNEINTNPPTFIQAIQSQPFRAMSILVVSSSLLPFILMCQYQRIQYHYNIDYIISQYTYIITIFCYGCIRFLFNFITEQWTYQLIIKSIGQMNILLLLGFQLSIWLDNKMAINILSNLLIISIAVLFSAFSTSIPKIFGQQASQGVFSFMLIIMGLSAILSNTIAYFVENLSMTLIYMSIKVFIGQLYVYRFI